MEFKFQKAKWQIDNEGAWLMLLVPDKGTLETFLNNMGDKVYNCIIKPFRKKRSLNANNYSYLLSDKLADALRISKEECHFLMLKRYGQKTVISVIKEAAKEFQSMVDYSEEIADTEMNGKTFTHIKVFKGSHLFDTVEMATYIDGIISECKEQGIPTDTPQEIARLKAEWGRRDE